MRSTFVPPTLEEFALIVDAAPIRSIRGGSLSDIEIFRVPARSVRGSGLFSLLSGLARKVVPFIARAVKPSAVEFGRNVITDLEEGNTNLRQVFRKRGIEALGAVGRRVLRGKGRKKTLVKKKKKKKKTKKSLCAIRKGGYKDVFSVV